MSIRHHAANLRTVGSAVPILPTFVRPATGTRPAQAHLWCQHCGDIHTHSVEPGHRVAHCHDKESPYRLTGYDLDVQGEVSEAEAVLPEAPYAGRRRLQDALSNATPRARSAILAAALESRTAHTVTKKIGRFRVSVIGANWWVDLAQSASSVGAMQGRRRAGRDLITLLAFLFGIGRGFAGLRLLEAVSGAAFASEHRNAIADAIEEAYPTKADFAGQDRLGAEVPANSGEGAP